MISDLDHALAARERDYHAGLELHARLQAGPITITPVTIAPRAEAFYFGMTPDVSDDYARQRFATVYGVAPLKVLRTAGSVLAGPIPGTGGVA